MQKQQYWIKNAIGKKRGALHRQLNIPTNQVIPLSVLSKIINAPVNSKINFILNNKLIVRKVTLLLKRRAVLALNLRKF